MTKPSLHGRWLAATAIAFFLSVGAARADMVDEATIACQAKTTIVQIGKYLAANDMRSYNKLVDKRTKTGECKPLKARTDIKIERSEGALACIKANGDAKCAWVLETALRITSDRREQVRQDYFACKTPLYLETGRNILAANDQEAITRFRFTTGKSGECLELRKGELVDIERRDDKILCVRPPAEDVCYWTDALALPASAPHEAAPTKASTVVRHRARRAK